MITINDVKKNEEVKMFLKLAERQMQIKGYTEHSFRHVGLVSKHAGNMLKDLGYPEREIELAKIAGFFMI